MEWVTTVSHVGRHSGTVSYVKNQSLTIIVLPYLNRLKPNQITRPTPNPFLRQLRPIPRTANLTSRPSGLCQVTLRYPNLPQTLRQPLPTLPESLGSFISPVQRSKPRAFQMQIAPEPAQAGRLQKADSFLSFFLLPFERGFEALTLLTAVPLPLPDLSASLP